jgi:hypothetical protein
MEKQHLNFAASLLGAEKPRREDPGIVHDQEITGPEKPGYILEMMMQSFVCRTIKHQQPGFVPLFGRLLGYLRIRQEKIIAAELKPVIHGRAGTGR